MVGIPTDLAKFFGISHIAYSGFYTKILARETDFIEQIIGQMPTGMPVLGDIINLNLDNDQAYWSYENGSFSQLYKVTEDTMEIIKGMIRFRSKPEGHEFPYTFCVGDTSSFYSDKSAAITAQKRWKVDLEYRTSIRPIIRAKFLFKDLKLAFSLDYRPNPLISSAKRLAKHLTVLLEDIDYYMDLQLTKNSDPDRVDRWEDFGYGFPITTYYLVIKGIIFKMPDYKDGIRAIRNYIESTSMPNDELRMAFGSMKRAN